MRPLAAITCAFALMIVREAGALPGETASASGQFVILGPADAFPARFPAVPPNSGIISLQPSVLAISCEHIKQALWQDLGADASWSGKIYLTLHSTRFPDEQAVLFAQKFGDRWIYRVDLPDKMDQRRYVRTIVQVLLLERANRGAGSHSAEIPDWLAEGFAQQLIASDGAEILPATPDRVENGKTLNWQQLDLTDVPRQAIPGLETRKLNPLAQAQVTLQSRPPLTFQQLSWPGEGQFEGEAGKVYRSCAQLFVNQLLKLKGGPICFLAMLDELPRRYNWQFAFLSGFRFYFQTPLDVEKWWALQLVQFTGRDLTQTWTTEESWKKLDEVLVSPAEVRTKSDELPLRTAVTLQTMIQRLKPEQQAQALQGRLARLDALRLRVSQDVVSLVDDYRDVIRTYLSNLPTSRGGFLFFRRQASGSENLIKETVRNLDALDVKREALRRLATAPIAANAVPGAASRR